MFVAFVGSAQSRTSLSRPDFPPIGIPYFLLLGWSELLAAPVTAVCQIRNRMPKVPVVLDPMDLDWFPTIPDALLYDLHCRFETTC
jgi:hypothetical protein